jgi:hypothetical protein
MYEEEMAGCERMVVREDALPLLQALDHRRIRTAIATRTHSNGSSSTL